MQTPQPQPYTPSNYQWGNNPSRSQLKGFYVNDPNNIRPGDVPMDGSISFFPAQDLSFIVIKQWNSMGQLDQMIFYPAPNQMAPQQPRINNPQSTGQAPQEWQTTQSSQTGQAPVNMQQPQMQIPVNDRQSDQIDSLKMEVGKSINDLCQVIQNGFEQMNKRFANLESNNRPNSNQNGQQNHKGNGGQPQ